MAHILHVANAGEGHLLLYIVAEPVAADGVAKHGRHNRSEEQPTVEHGLEGETTAEGNRRAPVGTDFAHSLFLSKRGTVGGTLLQFREVVGDVGILGLET